MFVNNLRKRTMGILSEYQKRAEIKTAKTHIVSETPQFFVTPNRPSNFGDHIDMKVQLDNWFEENRVHNEENPEIKRTQIYLMNAAFYAGVFSLARVFAIGVIGRLAGWKKYDKDTYMEVDVSDLPPGEVMQIVWNGEPVFVRRLTHSEVKEENELPESTLLDPNTGVELLESNNKNSKIIVTSAVCTHLGCIPIPYLGKYKGSVCICHGSVYDKFGRVRQGPALQNLKVLNSSLYDTILCIEELKYPSSPSEIYWA